jgi:DNA primase
MPTWEETAKALPYGSSAKVLHCGSSPAARAYNSPSGISIHCFRCGDREFIPHGPRSAAEILAARVATEALREAREMPKRCVPMTDPDNPSEALLWTLRTGLTPEEATDVYGFKYDPETRRVCIPLTGGFIARAVFREQPKYIRAGSMEQHTWVQHVDGSTSVVVIEDILSAIKVYRAGFSSCAVLGTSITPEAAAVIGSYANAVCWTDADKAGDAAYVKLRKRLSLYETTLHRVRTDRDPKLIHISDIRSILKEKI